MADVLPTMTASLHTAGELVRDYVNGQLVHRLGAFTTMIAVAHFGGHGRGSPFGFNTKDMNGRGVRRPGKV